MQFRGMKKYGLLVCFVDGTWCGKDMNGDYMDVDIFSCGVFLNGF